MDDDKSVERDLSRMPIPHLHEIASGSAEGAFALVNALKARATHPTVSEFLSGMCAVGGVEMVPPELEAGLFPTAEIIDGPEVERRKAKLVRYGEMLSACYDIIIAVDHPPFRPGSVHVTTEGLRVYAEQCLNCIGFTDSIDFTRLSTGMFELALNKVSAVLLHRGKELVIDDGAVLLADLPQEPGAA